MPFKDTVFHSRCRQAECQYHIASSSHRHVMDEARNHIHYNPTHNVHVTSITYTDVEEVSNAKTHAKV